jgi:hypothetical protein
MTERSHLGCPLGVFDLYINTGNVLFKCVNISTKERHLQTRDASLHWL